MPELPEVETIVRDIRPHVERRRIRQVRVIKPDILRNIGARSFLRLVKGRLIISVSRRAKHVILSLDGGYRVVVQPGMTGSLLLASNAKDADAYVTIEYALDEGRRLLHRDVRRIGAVYLLSPQAWSRYDASLGLEPLAPEFTPASLGVRLAGGRLAIKRAIMDQRRLAGVGNIYASEALWLARIDPSRESRRLTRADIERLHRAIVGVLRRAIAGRGTTFRDYRTGTGARGRYQERLAVYGRAGLPCPRCRRRIVLTHAIDARATYFCPSCQLTAAGS
jgi:formamidopyrimidine-DNA glycosylase